MSIDLREDRMESEKVMIIAQRKRDPFFARNGKI
jgi:hypothetical protein